MSARGPRSVVSEHQPGLELATHATQRRRGEHAFRRAALPHIDVHARDVGLGRGDDAGHVAVGDELYRSADAADAGDDLLVTRAIENKRADAFRLYALRLWPA